MCLDNIQFHKDLKRPLELTKKEEESFLEAELVCQKLDATTIINYNLYM